MYEQGSFEPVARVVQLSEVLEKQRIAEKILYIQQHVPSEVINQDFYDNIEKAKTPLTKIYHYHSNHLGTPQELTNQDGDVIWLSYDRAWGGSFETIYKQQFIDNFAITENELQPIKFQGQSLDTETGLHYNRFRYYDSDVGMFISRDPIGLLGGNNVFQYAPNPIGWIDPWGLKARDCSNTTRAEREEWVRKRPERYRRRVVQKVWDNAKDKDGKVFDPFTGEELFWDKSKNRQGQWDMGHRKGKSYDSLKKKFIDGKITYQDYLDEYNNPENYFPQGMNGNRSKKYD